MEMTRFARLEVCSDCYMAAANGADSVEFASAELMTDWRNGWNAAVLRHGAPLEPTCVNGEHEYNEFDEPSCHGDTTFSKAPCDWCRSTLAGNRHCATVFLPE